MLVGTYNPWLVAISLLVAVMASYTALAMAGRTVTAPGRGAAWWWRLGGGFAMGLGIWSMHFIGMLAFDLPIPVGYDLGITLYSLAVSIGASAYALWLVYAGGLDNLLLSVLLYVPGVVLFALTRRQRGERVFTRWEWVLFGAILAVAIATLVAFCRGELAL